MDRDLLNSAVRELCMRFRSAAPRIQERAREITMVSGSTQEHAEETAALDVIFEFAAAYKLEPYVFAVRMGVRDHVEGNRLIAAYEREMTEDKPTSSTTEPLPPSSIDILPLYEVPPRGE